MKNKKKHLGLILGITVPLALIIAAVSVYAALVVKSIRPENIVRNTIKGAFPDVYSLVNDAADAAKDENGKRSLGLDFSARIPMKKDESKKLLLSVKGNVFDEPDPGYGLLNLLLDMSFAKDGDNGSGSDDKGIRIGLYADRKNVGASIVADNKDASGLKKDGKVYYLSVDGLADWFAGSDYNPKVNEDSPLTVEMFDEIHSYIESFERVFKEKFSGKEEDEVIRKCEDELGEEISRIIDAKEELVLLRSFLPKQKLTAEADDEKICRIYDKMKEIADRPENKKYREYIVEGIDTGDVPEGKDAFDYFIEQNKKACSEIDFRVSLTVNAENGRIADIDLSVSIGNAWSFGEFTLLNLPDGDDGAEAEKNGLRGINFSANLRFDYGNAGGLSVLSGKSTDASGTGAELTCHLRATRDGDGKAETLSAEGGRASVSVPETLLLSASDEADKSGTTPDGADFSCAVRRDDKDGIHGYTLIFETEGTVSGDKEEPADKKSYTYTLEYNPATGEYTFRSSDGEMNASGIVRAEKKGKTAEAVVFSVDRYELKKKEKYVDYLEGVQETDVHIKCDSPVSFRMSRMCTDVPGFAKDIDISDMPNERKELFTDMQNGFLKDITQFLGDLDAETEERLFSVDGYELKSASNYRNLLKTYIEGFANYINLNGKNDVTEVRANYRNVWIVLRYSDRTIYGEMYYKLPEKYENLHTCQMNSNLSVSSFQVHTWELKEIIEARSCLEKKVYVRCCPICGQENRSEDLSKGLHSYRAKEIKDSKTGETVAVYWKCRFCSAGYYIENENGKFEFEAPDGKAMLVKGSPLSMGQIAISSEIMIPQYADYEKKVPVTEIGERAFNNYYDILQDMQYKGRKYDRVTSVTVPDGVEKIGNFAFGGMAEVQKLVLPASVKKIGKSIFGNNSTLKDIYFMGTQAEWDKVDKSEAQSLLSKATVHIEG